MSAVPGSSEPACYELGSLRGGAGASLAALPSSQKKASVLTLAAASSATAPANAKLRVITVLGDGRCMFRALVRPGVLLSSCHDNIWLPLISRLCGPQHSVAYHASVEPHTQVTCRDGFSIARLAYQGVEAA